MPSNNKPPIFGPIVDWSHDPKQGDSAWVNSGNDPELKGVDTTGWYPVWKDSLAGQEIMSQQTQDTITQREKDLSDPNSKYYTDYYKQLKGTLSAASSPASFLALNRASGLGVEGSATIANSQRKTLEGKISDYATTGMQNLFQANTSGATSLLGLQQNNNQFQQSLAFNKQQYEDSKKFDWGSLLKIGGQIAGMALAPATGGASLAASNVLSNMGSFTDPTAGKKWTVNGYQ
jgi:hypothetical protein